MSQEEEEDHFRHFMVTVVLPGRPFQACLLFSVLLSMQKLLGWTIPRTSSVTTLLDSWMQLQHSVMMSVIVLAVTSLLPHTVARGQRLLPSSITPGYSCLVLRHPQAWEENTQADIRKERLLCWVVCFTADLSVYHNLAKWINFFSKFTYAMLSLCCS